MESITRSYPRLLTQLSGFGEHEMNNHLALCELAARAPNIGVGHKIKQAWLLNDRVFMLGFPTTTEIIRSITFSH